MRKSMREGSQSNRRHRPGGQRKPGNSDGAPFRKGRSTNITVETRSIREIKLNPRNCRTHSSKQVRQIANSILAFGFTNPLLVNERNELIAGHGRYKAAQLLGLVNVPVIVLAMLSPARQRALAIADNKIAANAGWDRERLAIEIPELTGLLETEGLDAAIFGFEAVEIDQLLTDFEAPILRTISIPGGATHARSARPATYEGRGIGSGV